MSPDLFPAGLACAGAVVRHCAFLGKADAAAERLVSDRLIDVAEDGSGFANLFDEP